jgi:hypothetical protein
MCTTTSPAPALNWNCYTDDAYTDADFARDVAAVEPLAVEALRDETIAAIFAEREACELTHTFDGVALDTFAIVVSGRAARRVEEALRAWECELGVRAVFTMPGCAWHVIRAEGRRYIVGRACA